jgi:hypothetical protein
MDKIEGLKGKLKLWLEYLEKGSLYWDTFGLHPK